METLQNLSSKTIDGHFGLIGASYGAQSKERRLHNQKDCGEIAKNTLGRFFSSSHKTNYWTRNNYDLVSCPYHCYSASGAFFRLGYLCAWAHLHMWSDMLLFFKEFCTNLVFIVSVLIVRQIYVNIVAWHALFLGLHWLLRFISSLDV